VVGARYWRNSQEMQLACSSRSALTWKKWRSLARASKELARAA
jgi:hypothetical protein